MPLFSCRRCCLRVLPLILMPQQYQRITLYHAEGRHDFFCHAAISLLDYFSPDCQSPRCRAANIFSSRAAFTLPLSPDAAQRHVDTPPSFADLRFAFRCRRVTSASRRLFNFINIAVHHQVNIGILSRAFATADIDVGEREMPVIRSPRATPIRLRYRTKTYAAPLAAELTPCFMPPSYALDADADVITPLRCCCLRFTRLAAQRVRYGA